MQCNAPSMRVMEPLSVETMVLYPAGMAPMQHHALPPPPAAPVLPMAIIEPILVLAPRLVPWARRATHLLSVVPRAAAPRAFQSLMLTCSVHDIDSDNDDDPTQAATFSLPYKKFFSDAGWDSSCSSLPSHLSRDLDLLLANDTVLDHTFCFWLHRKLIIAAVLANEPQLLDLVDAGYGLLANWPDYGPVLEAASAHGSIHVLEWLGSHGYTPLASTKCAIFNCVKRGFVDGLEWLHQHNLLPTDAIKDIMKQACTHGHTEVTSFLCRAFGAQRVQWSYKHWELMCQHGHVRLLEWVRQRTVGQLPVLSSKAMDLASEHGHVDALDWWIMNSEQPLYSAKAMDMASANGHLHVLEWWARSGLEMRFTPAAKTVAFANGHWDVVKFWTGCAAFKCLTSTCANQDPRLAPWMPKDDPITLAAFGHLGWLQALHAPLLDSIRNPRFVMTWAHTVVRFGHIHILQAFPKLFEQAVDLANDTSSRGNPDLVHPLVTAAKHGQLSSLQWCFANSPKNDVFDRMQVPSLGDCARMAVKHGHQHVLFWLLSNTRYRLYMDKLRSLAEDLVDLAIDKTGTDFLEMLWCSGVFFPVNKDHFHYTLTCATNAGSIPVLEWCKCKFDEVAKETQSRVVSDQPLCSFLRRALFNEDISVLKWWLAEYQRNGWNPPTRLDDSGPPRSLVLQLIATHQHVSLKWIRQHLDPSPSDRRLIDLALASNLTSTAV